MDVLGGRAIQFLKYYLSYYRFKVAIASVFDTFASVILAAVILTFTIYFIRKILSGANKGKAHLR